MDKLPLCDVCDFLSYLSHRYKHILISWYLTDPYIAILEEKAKRGEEGGRGGTVGLHLSRLLPSLACWILYLYLFCWAVSSNKPSSHRKHGIAGRMKRPLDPYMWIQRPMATDTVTGGKRNAPRPCMMSSLLAQSVTDTREWLVLSRRLPHWRWTGSTLSLPPLLFLRKLIGWKKRCLLFCVANFSRRTSKPSATRPTALFKQGKRRNWRSAWWGFDVSQGTAGVSALGSCQSYSASAAVCNLSVTADFENAFNWRGHLGSLLLCCPLSRPIASPPYRPCHLCRELHQYLLSAGFWVEYEGEKKKKIQWTPVISFNFIITHLLFFPSLKKWDGGVWGAWQRVSEFV